jgi:multidrug resistance efflux pump
MDALPPIPTPAGQRWREFRIQFLPFVTFALVLTGLVCLWRTFVMPATIIGTVDSITYNINAKEDGVLSALTVDRFENVKCDQPLGIVTVMEKEVLDASLAALETDLRVMKIRMDLDRTRNLQALMDMRLALPNEKQALAIAEITLQQRESEYARVINLNTQPGIGSNVISQAELEVALRDRNMAQVEVTHKKELIAQYEQGIKTIEQLGQVQISTKDLTIEEDIKAQREKLLQLSKPLPLTAPSDGKVSMVFKRAGERVMRGEPILSIIAPASDRVIGYIRQPLNVLPTTNDIAIIRTRTQKRTVIEGQIMEVGPSLIPLEPALLSADTRRREVGLPILIKLPPNAALTPGEFVDISIQYAKR